MRHLIHSRFWLCIVIGFLSSCASLKVDSWMDPAFTERPMGKVMVVGVTDSESLQRQYEELFVTGLKEAGAEATASSEMFSPGSRVSEEELGNALAGEAVNSVLVTRVIDEKEKAQYHAPVAYPHYAGSYFGYYSYSFDYVHQPGYIVTYVEIHLETNLYDVDSGKLVWSGRKKITDERSNRKNMERVIKATIGDLRKNGLL